ncbi:MAG: glycosyltransferase [Paludibacteraceae bacterium]|nr:glycosyltransferase [Paludibacteraceae bacterium]
MKIVLLGTAYPYRGGLAAFNERLARAFMAEGHAVELWTFTLQYPSFLFPGKTQYSEEQAPSDLRIVRCLNSCDPLSWVRVGRRARREAPDMLICCYWMSFMAPAFSTVERIAKRNGKTRCIALVHNILPHEPSLLDKCLTPLFIGATDGYVALSQSVADEIGRLAGRDVPRAWSPHPIYDHYGAQLSKAEACERLGIAADKEYMLFFGLVRAYKGLDLLIDAFGQVAAELPNLRLLIAGEFYEDEEKYREQIRRHGLEDKVVVHNAFVADGDVQNWFGAASLVVQPYKTASQSGVTQVAFHFEKPMLVTNVGGLGEIVHDGQMGYAVAPTAEHIADALRDYYTADREAAFTAYVRSEKAKYGWDKMTGTFEKVRNMF